MSIEAASPVVPAAGIAARYPLLHAVFVDPSRQTIIFCAIGALCFYAIIMARAVISSDHYVIPDVAVVGGDFTAFWMAAKTFIAEGAGALYHPDTLNARLNEAFPGRGGFSLFWQYPPTAYFIIAPFAALSYPAALWSWITVTTSLAFAALRSLWRTGLPLLAAFASAAAWQGWVSGQTGFLTVALIAVAGGWADRRPIIAGIAAGLLTVKPQLGLLIPVAYAAAGCWRAFGAAAISGIAMAGLSLVLFGADTWLGFFDAMNAHSERMNEVIFPYHKLVTPYGFLMTLHAPSWCALTLQAIASLVLASFVFFTWRKSTSWEVRLIALSSATLLATPYAFYYEGPVFFAAMLMTAKLAMERGWLRYEKHGLIALWALPVLAPGPSYLPIPAMIAFAAFALCARRVWHECGFQFPRFKTLSNA